MSAIQPLSSLTPLSELDLFGVPPTQNSIERNLYTEHRPISVLSSQSPIQFEIETGDDESLQFRESMLHLQVRVDMKKANGSEITAADWPSVCPVNYWLHSMFKEVNVEINGKLITQSPQTYAYKAYIEQLLAFTDDAKNTHLSGALYASDNAVDKEASITKRVEFIKPTSAAKDGKGKVVDLMGKLHIDLAFQGRALLGGSTVKITLLPNNPSFYLLCNKNHSLTMEFINASLFVHRSKVSRDIVNAHKMALQKSSAKYLMRRSEVKPFTVSAGTLSVHIDHVKTGMLPSRIFAFMVTNKAFNGSLDKNPYNFQHFNCNYIACILNGEQIPAKAYTPNFSTGLYIREYMGFLECLNQLTTDTVVNVSRDLYAVGNTIFGFNLVPDLSDGYNMSGHVNPIRRGNLGLEIKFSTAITETITVLVYCEYDSIMEIDNNKEVFVDQMQQSIQLKMPEMSIA